LTRITDPRNRYTFLATCILASAAILAVMFAGNSNVLAQGRGGGGGRASTADRIDNGKKIFAAQKCDTCHGAQGEGGSAAIRGPQIAAYSSDLASFTDHVRHPKDPMPAFSAGQVSDADLSDVLAYLKSIGGPSMPANANAQNGSKLFVSAGCYECHDRQGQGGGAGPRIAPNPIAFGAFLNQCRQPADQMPPYTSKVLSDAQLADIYAFLQSIPKPPDPSTISILQ
jgi:mono/diheme cytochrome c family protein